MNVQIFDQNMLMVFWLCFTRWAAVSFQLPIFDHASIPGIVKILSSLVITYAFFPYTYGPVLQDLQYVGVQNFWLITIGYAVIGLAIGYLIRSIMSIFIAGGSIITQQVGFGAMRYFDPTAAQSLGPFERLIQLAILILIISSGALIPMFKGVFITFESIRFLDFGSLGDSPVFFVGMFKSIFVSAILLASPLLFTNFLLYMILGVVAKTIPQMNVLMVSFVVNIGVGLLVFLSISNEFFQVGYEIYVKKLGEWFQFVI